MIPGPQEFIDAIQGMAFRRAWQACPAERSLRACRAEALALNDDSGDPVVETAALFFALSRDERRTRPQPHVLPIAVALHHLHDHRLALRTRDPAELGWLRHAIAEGSTDWPSVRAWFIERCGPRGHAV